MFLYQQNQHYFAQIAEGLEDSGTDELRRLGAREIRPAYRGLHFEAEKAALYRINYQSRLVTRVLAPLAAFPCHEPDYLYRKAKLIPWKEIMGVDQTLAVFANLSNSKIRHSQYAALCLKDAIVDYFRDDCGRRPDVRRVERDGLHFEAGALAQMVRDGIAQVAAAIGLLLLRLTFVPNEYADDEMWRGG